MNITGGINGKLFPCANLNNEQDRLEYEMFTAYLREHSFTDYILLSTVSITYLFIKITLLEDYYKLVEAYNTGKVDE